MTGNPYLDSLNATRDSLKASIEKREKQAAGGMPVSTDFNKVTAQEKMRLAEVEGEIAALQSAVK